MNKQEYKELVDYNYGAKSVLDAIPLKYVDEVFAQLQKFEIKGGMIWCVYKDICDQDDKAFLSMMLTMKKRPKGCRRNCYHWKDSMSF